MFLRTEGIVINTFDYGEADRIVTFFTLDKGKLKGLAKSCRKTKSRFGSSLEPFTHSKISLYGKETSSLTKIIQSDILHSHRKLREDLERLAYGSHIADLVNELCPEAEANRGLFHLLSYIFGAMGSDTDLESLSFIFYVHFLRQIGYQPRLDSCVKCGKGCGMKFYPSYGGILCGDCSNPEAGSILLTPETKETFYKILRLHLQNHSYQRALNLDLSLRVRRELKSILTFHLNYILGKKPKSSDFLNLVT